MAVIPRYFSQSATTPAVTNAYADPNTTGAVAMAQARGTEQIWGTIQTELGNWDKVVTAQQQAEQQQAQQQAKLQGEMYKAEALSAFQMQANDLYNKHAATTDGVTNFAKPLDQDFKMLSEKVIMGAPDDATRVDVLKSVLNLRSQMYNRASNESRKANNQINMNKMEGMLNGLEGLAASSPAMAEQAMTQGEQVLNSMAALGVRPQDIEKVRMQFRNNVATNALKTEIDNDPLNTERRLKNGEFAHLGENKIKQISSMVETTKRAYTKRASDTIEEISNRLYAGQPIPENVNEFLLNGVKYGLNDQVTELKQLMAVDQEVARSSYSDLIALKSQIGTKIAEGSMDISPERAAKLMKFIDGNIQAMKDDGISYTERRGGFPSTALVQDFTKVNPALAETRRLRALQAQEAYGVETSPLKQPEVDLLKAQLEKAPTPEKVKIINNLQAYGPTATSKIAENLDKTDKGVSTLLRTHTINPKLTEEVLSGKEMLANKTVKAPTEKEVLDTSERVLGTLFADDPERRKAYVDIAVAKHAYDTAKGTSTTLEDSMKSAVGVIKVGRPGWFSGSYKTVAPVAGMDSDGLEALVNEKLGRGSTAWTTFGNGQPATINGTPINFNNIKPDYFDYVYDGKGKYFVMVEGKPVLTTTGRPAVIDLTGLANKGKVK